MSYRHSSWHIRRGGSLVYCVGHIAWRVMRRYRLSTAGDWNRICLAVANRLSGNPNRTCDRLIIRIRERRQHRKVIFAPKVANNYGLHSQRYWQRTECCSARLIYEKTRYARDRMAGILEAREKRLEKSCEWCESQMRVEYRFHSFGHGTHDNLDNHGHRLCEKCDRKYLALAKRFQSAAETRLVLNKASSEIKTIEKERSWQRASAIPENCASSSST